MRNFKEDLRKMQEEAGFTREAEFYSLIKRIFVNKLGKAVENSQDVLARTWQSDYFRHNYLQIAAAAIASIQCKFCM